MIGWVTLLLYNIGENGEAERLIETAYLEL